MKEKSKERKKEEAEQRSREERAQEKKKLTKKEEKLAKRKGTFTVWSSIGTGLYGKFVKVLKYGPIGSFLTSYDRFEDAARNSFTATMPRDQLIKHRKKKYRPKREIGTENIDGSLSIYNPATLRQPVSSRFRRAVWKNKLISRMIRRVSDIPHAPVSALGTFVFSMGVACVLAQILRFLLGTELTGVIGGLVCGFLLLLISVPIISKNNVSIGHYVLTGRFGYRILSPMLGLTEEWDFDRDEVRQPGWFNIIAALIGLICGGVTFLFTLQSVVLTVLLTVLCVLTVRTPELGLNIILIFLPFARLYAGGSLILGLFTAFTAFTFLLNVLLGKRVMRFEAFDFVVLIFSFFVICSELFVPGDYNPQRTVLTVLVCAMLYFLIKNLFRAEKWIRCCMDGLISASCLVSVLGIAQAISLRRLYITSVFDKSEQLAAYLLLTLFLTVGSLHLRKLRSLSLVLTLIAQLTCLVLTGSKLAITAFLLAFLLYLGVSGRKLFSVILLTLLCLPLTLPVLPQAVVDKISGFLLWQDPGLLIKSVIWKNSLVLCRAGIFGGIGMSDEAFSGMYSVAASGTAVPTAANASSLWLDLLIRAGLIGLVIFAFLILLFVRQSFTFYNRYLKASTGSHIHLSVFCSLSALLLFGFVSGVWSSEPCLCLFWLMIGFAVAIKDAVIRERTYYQRELSPTEGEISIGCR